MIKDKELIKFVDNYFQVRDGWVIQQALEKAIKQFKKRRKNESN